MWYYGTGVWLVGEGAVSDIQITCINKILRDHAYEGITHVGNSGGKWATFQVIAWIESALTPFIPTLPVNVPMSEW